MNKVKHKYPVNTVLYTKDGTRLGNALIVEYDRLLPYLCNIRTDYGNYLSISEQELENYFTIGSICSYSHKHRVVPEKYKQLEGSPNQTHIKVYQQLDEWGIHRISAIGFNRDFRITPDMSLSDAQRIYRQNLVSKLLECSADNPEAGETSFVTNILVEDIPDEPVLKRVTWTKHTLILKKRPEDLEGLRVPEWTSKQQVAFSMLVEVKDKPPEGYYTKLTLTPSRCVLPNICIIG